VCELAAAAEMQVRRCTETSGLDRRGERERAQELHHAGTCNGRGMAANAPQQVGGISFTRKS